MIVIFATSFGAAALGLGVAWFAAKHIRRQVAPLLALALAVMGAYLTSQFDASLDQRELALTGAIGLIALFVGSSGFLFLRKPENAMMFSGYATLVFVVTLPLTGFVFSCALIQSCH